MSELYPILRALKMGPSGGGGGGGFTPTEEQLAAVNSGITAEKLQQDETNISSLQQTIGDINSVLEEVL